MQVYDWKYSRSQGLWKTDKNTIECLLCHDDFEVIIVFQEKRKKVSPSMKILWSGRHVWRYWRRSFRGRASISSSSFHLSHLPHCSRLFSISKNIWFRFSVSYRFRYAYRNISNLKLCWVENLKKMDKNGNLIRFRFLIDFDTRIETYLIQSYVELKFWQKWELNSFSVFFVKSGS
jgi:hypothetical protein